MASSHKPQIFMARRCAAACHVGDRFFCQHSGRSGRRRADVQEGAIRKEWRGDVKESDQEGTAGDVQDIGIQKNYPATEDVVVRKEAPPTIKRYILIAFHCPMVSPTRRSSLPETLKEKRSVAFVH
ncbi:hypothetical protein ACP4OV_007029 [Aristida adscensionis]